MRTTIIANDAVLCEIKALARRMERSMSAVIEEALTSYIQKFKRSKTPSFTAIGKSAGRPSIARQTDEYLLKQAGKKTRGFE